MGKTALITGASKGLGKEFASIFASEGCDLILVARSEGELLGLKELLEDRYNISVCPIVRDLARTGAAIALFNEINNRGIDVDFLVNNAGFGDYGFFVDTPWERYEAMINLNVTTLSHLMHLFISDWKQKGRKGKILNVSSTAAFQPGPMMAVYFATKSFVLHLSEAIGNELKGTSITVTALCPGPTATHFGEVSKMNASQLVKNVRIADAKDVARLGFKAMMKGKPTVIHGGLNKVPPFLLRFLPRQWGTWLSAKVMRQK